MLRCGVGNATRRSPRMPGSPTVTTSYFGADSRGPREGKGALGNGNNAVARSRGTQVSYASDRNQSAIHGTGGRPSTALVQVLSRCRSLNRDSTLLGCPVGWSVDQDLSLEPVQQSQPPARLAPGMPQQTWSCVWVAFSKTRCDPGGRFKLVPQGSIDNLTAPEGLQRSIQVDFSWSELFAVNPSPCG